MNATKKIYILEDDVYIARVYQRAFTFAGYDIEIVSDPLKAIEDLPKMDPKPGVIVLDVMLPKMSGYDVLKILRREDSLKNIPIAILTNSVADIERGRFIEAGADLYMVKIDNEPRDLVKKIQDLMANGRSS